MVPMVQMPNHLVEPRNLVVMRRLLQIMRSVAVSRKAKLGIAGRYQANASKVCD
jgi:hypothetical protein